MTLQDHREDPSTGLPQACRAVAVQNLYPAEPGAEKALDLLALLRASQSLSEALALGPLLERLMALALEHAGADTGVLLRPRGAELLAVVQGAVAGGTPQVTWPAAGAPAAVPVAILNQVRRTNQYLVVADVESEPAFAADSQVHTAKTRSVLCMPLLRQGTIVAVLYLANNRLAGAFTRDRITALEVLAAQAAISLENAEHHARLVQEHRQCLDAEARARQHSAELAQRLMARTAELQAANRELEGFSYSVAHDLCAPLRTISGFSRALQEDYGDQLALEAQEYLRRLRAGCTSMAERIEDLLRLSRATTGELERSTVDISRLAGQIAAGLAETGRGRQVQFVISPELTAQADGRLLHIALENLLSNAWKYTSRRPSAVIEVGCYVRDDGQRVFLVRDNGAGFDMKFAGRLFMPFQRLHATTQFDGTGVGLATVQRIIARHGGSIWAQAAIDQGATFFFTVP